MDAKMASLKSTGTYVDAVPPSGANIVDGMWIFRVKRPPGSLPAFKARYVARGFSQRQGVDYFQTFSPTPKMTTLRVLLHVDAQRDYDLHSLDLSTAFLQGSLHEEIWLRRPPGFTGTFPAGTQWSLQWPVYGLRQAPLEWHNTLRTTLGVMGFTPSTTDPSLFLRIDTLLPPFYVLVYVNDLVFATADNKALTLVKSPGRARCTITLTQSHMLHQVLQRFGFQFSSPHPTPLSTGHSLSAPPLNESAEPSGPYLELVGCLMYLITCTRPDLAYPFSLVAPGRHRKVHWDAAKRVLCYLCRTSGMGLVLGGWGPVVLTGHADASWELRLLTYLLTDLGEQPRLPPVLYVDNKAMIALCQEHRLEDRTKHIALQYFLARELQQRGQLHLAYVASKANIADIFTKALQSDDPQRYSTMLARIRGEGHEHYFLLVVDDYSRYTTVFSLRSKGEVTEVLIDWIHAARLQLRERFVSDFPVLRLHSDRGGEFSSDLLRAFYRAEGIRQTFMLPASPQQNGIAERRIGMINLQPQVSLPETSPTLRWTGQVGDASAFRVWGSRALVQDLSTDKLSSRAVPCVFLGFPPDALAGSFTTPPRVVFCAPRTSHAVAPIEVAADSGASRGAEPGCAASRGAAPGRAESGGAGPGGAEPGGAGSGGAEPGRAESGGAERERAEPGGAEPGAAESGGVEPTGTGPGSPLGALSRRELPSPQELREWFARRSSRAAGAGGTAFAGGSMAARGSGAGGAAGAGTGGSTSAGGAGATGPKGARIGGTGAAEPGGAPGAGATGGAGAGGAAGVGATGGSGAGAAVSAGGPARAGGAARVGADAGGTGVVLAGSGGAARPRLYFVPLLEQVLGLPPSPSPAPSLECPPHVQFETQLQLVSPLPAPSPYAGPTGGLTERREPESRPASPIRPARTSRRVPRSRPLAVPGTHQMALRPPTMSQRVPLPSPPASSFPALADPESDSLRAACPTVTRVLATVVTDPSFESTAASALVTERVDFAAHCRLDFGASLVAECASCFAVALPHLVSTLLAPEGDLDAPDIPTPRSYAEVIEGPYSSQWQAAMDAEMASWKSTGTYVDEVPPPGANIVSGMWIFKVKRPPGSPPVFKARYVARGFSQRQGVDYFQTFSPTPKMTTLRVLLHVAAQRDYELYSLDFSTAFLQGNLHEEIWLRRPPGFTGSFPSGTQWSLRRPVYGLRQAPREWHDTLRTTLSALGFAPSTADPSLFLRTDNSLPPFYILVYVDDLVFATADTAGLAHVKSELQKRHTCTDLGELRSYLGLQITRDRAQRTITLTQSHMVQQVL
ncbi:unnamed protein product [Closterium sp. NIES-53]